MKRIPLRSRIFDQLKKVPGKGWLLMGINIVTAVVLLGAFLVRRQVVEFRQEHQFGVDDPGFWGSAHALADPVLLSGNKIEL